MMILWSHDIALISKNHALKQDLTSLQLHARDMVLCFQLILWKRKLIQSKLSLRQLLKPTSSSYDHLCETPFELGLKLCNEKLP